MGHPHEHLYWRTGAGFALIEGDWKIAWPRRENGLPDNPERPDLTKTEMYYLSADVSEKSNLASSEPDRVAAMLALWTKWDNELVPPLWGTWKKKGVTTEEQPDNHEPAGQN